MALGLTRRQHDRLVKGGAIAAAATFLAVAAWASGLVAPLERILYDQRTAALRASVEAPEEIVVLLIDEASLAAMNPVVGRWPWPRAVFGEILEFLSLGTPRAVVVDILFTEDEAAGPGGGDGDLALARAGAASGRVIHAFQLFADDEADAPAPMPEAVTGRFAVGDNGPAPPAADGYAAFQLPLEPVAESARRLGVVTTRPDRDGVYRTLPPLHRYDGRLFPALGTAAALDAGAAVTGGALLDAEGRPAPLSATGAVPVNYYGEFETVSMSAVLDSIQRLHRGDLDGLPVDPREFDDRIVFIGASAVGLHDLKATPLSGTTPGVFLHASLTGNLLTGGTLSTASSRGVAAATVLLALLTAAAILASNRLLLQIGVPALVAAGWIGWTFHRQAAAGVVWEAAGPLAAVAVVSLATFAFLGFTEGRERARVHRMLGQYVSPTVLQEVLDQKTGIIGADVGASEELTILFSDLRGFTSLSEKLPPEQLVEALNTYLGAMSEKIFEQEGTLDKFIGDAILAFWGAPIHQPDHADRAVRAAFLMVRGMDDVNRRLAELGAPPLAMGVGLHSGRAILGNIGSEKKLDYTVIGDAVNLASRVEGLTKGYGAPLLVTEDTRERLDPGTICMQVDLVRVKGRNRPVAIYAPLALPDDPQGVRDTARAAAAAAGEGFRRYLERDWAAALDSFSRMPEGVARDQLIERCKELAAEPPPDDWDGVRTMETK